MMAVLTSLTGLAIITKAYSMYAFTLAFILQSSATLLVAFLACGLHIYLRHKYAL